jgi:hypothetical protein
MGEVRPVSCHDREAGFYFSILPGGYPFGCGHGGFADGAPLPSFAYTGGAVPAAKLVFAVLISACVGVGIPAIVRSSDRYHRGARNERYTGSMDNFGSAYHRRLRRRGLVTRAFAIELKGMV